MKKRANRKVISTVKSGYKIEFRTLYKLENGTINGYTKDERYKKQVGKIENGNFYGVAKFKNPIFSEKRIQYSEEYDIQQGTLIDDEVYFTCLSYGGRHTRFMESQLKLYESKGYRVRCRIQGVVYEGVENVRLQLEGLWDLCDKLQFDMRFNDDILNGYVKVTAIYQVSESKKTYNLDIQIK